MDKRKIALDVDGVLANFYLHLCRRYGKPYIPLKRWDEKWIGDVFHEVVKDEKFWLSIPTLAPPEEINFEVTAYVTALPPPMKAAREFWLKANGYPNAPVYVTNKKVPILKELDITDFVDDKQANCDEIRAAGIICWKYIPNYMHEQPFPYDIRNLNEIL